MEREQLQQLAQELVTEITSRQKMTRSALARRLNVNASQISHLMNTPELLSDELLLRIVNALRPKTDFNLVNTSNFATVQEVCRDAQRRHRMVSIIGYPGAGKTVALDEYTRYTANVAMIEAKSTMNRKQFLAEVLRQMGVAYTGNVYDMGRMLAQELNTRENPLIIIDEVSKLHWRSLLDLHSLRNDTMQNAGIVLAGCEYFYTNLRNSANRQKEGIPEFFSRVMAWVELAAPTRREIAAICRENGIVEAETVKEFQQLKNFRELYNAITNELEPENPKNG